MASSAPITLNIADNMGHLLFSQAVPFTAGISARGVLEQAFILAQTPSLADPFEFTVSYFGYSQSPQFPGLLGYEIESLYHLPNNAQFYWGLSINGVSSPTGADTTFPPPGASVAWVYTAVPTLPAIATTHAHEVHGRRASRRAGKA